MVSQGTITQQKTVKKQCGPTQCNTSCLPHLQPHSKPPLSYTQLERTQGNLKQFAFTTLIMIYMQLLKVIRFFNQQCTNIKTILSPNSRS
jgi:hypothetical protein